MGRASRMAALTGTRRCRCWIVWPTPLRHDEKCSAANSRSVRPSRRRDRSAWGAYRSAPWCRLFQHSLAAAADALDLAIKRRVFLVGGIARNAQILLRRHLIGARLAVADRGFTRRGGIGSARRSGLATRLRHRDRSTHQDQQRHRYDQLSHLNSPPAEISTYLARSGISIVAQLRRPWAAQS